MAHANEQVPAPYRGALEFVGGGPLDGMRRECPSGVVRVASRSRHGLPVHEKATPDLVRRLPHHVYRIARAECEAGCCHELVMQYDGMEGPDAE